MDKTKLKEGIVNAFTNFKKAIGKHREINSKRADGGWSVGQIGKHIIKATKSSFGATEKAKRPYGQHAAEIKDLFLNFELKFPAAPELEPEAGTYTATELYDQLDKNLNAILAMIDTEDLTEVCTEIELPVWGTLTKYEWLVLIENHTIRHTHQINTFKSQ